MEAIPVLYEDNDILVVNKPAGLSVHGDGRSLDTTLTDWLLTKYPELATVGEPMQLLTGEIIDRPGIVHRLDKNTSGVLMVAKNQTSFHFLKEEFQKRGITKHYRLLVYGRLELKMGEIEGEINLPIGRSRRDPRLRVASHNAVGRQREALTYYRPLEVFSDYTYVDAEPKSGRTHQLRAHFKAIQHPIVGDTLYAPDKPSLPGLARQALHAYSLELSWPGKGDLVFKAELPGDISAALDYLRTL